MFKDSGTSISSNWFVLVRVMTASEFQEKQDSRESHTQHYNQYAYTLLAASFILTKRATVGRVMMVRAEEKQWDEEKKKWIGLFYFSLPADSTGSE